MIRWCIIIGICQITCALGQPLTLSNVSFQAQIAERLASIEAVRAENHRSAANIVVTLSGNVMTAALAVLAGQISFVAFFFERERFYALSKKGRFWFSVLNVSAVFALVASIISGGRGVAEIYKNGFRGDWMPDPAGDNFQFQTVVCLLGLLLVLVSIAVGITRSKPSAEAIETSKVIDQLNERLQRIEKRVFPRK